MGQSYTKHQGYIDGLEMFDAKFFGVSSAEVAGAPKGEGSRREGARPDSRGGSREIRGEGVGPEPILTRRRVSFPQT